MNDIKCVILDCDGVLTDGFYHVSDNGVLTKSFYTRDIWAIEEILKEGTAVCIVTQASDRCVVEKTKNMAKRHLHLTVCTGVEDKFKFINSILPSKKITWENVAYMGDAENDLECIKAAGWSVCPADAVPIVKEHAELVCDNRGGRGAVHEAIGHFLMVRENAQQLECPNNV